MKKIITLLMSLILVLSLAACGDNQQAQNPTTEPSSKAASEAVSKPETSEETSRPSSAAETESADSTERKTLVVYYSSSGNTEEVANYIAEATDGDLFKLEPVEPYTDADLDWTDGDSRVSREHDNEDQRHVELVSASVENWDSYDTVFVGYPIWWGIAAWPVDGFVEANDFTGKMVIPFCTSVSSDLGESGELLQKLAGTGDWQKGERFRSGASEETVQSWIDGLGL